MKRWFAFVLLSLVALSSVMPLWGVEHAQAQQARNPANSTDYVELSTAFKDKENTSNAGQFWLGPQSGGVTHNDSGVYKTTAKLSARLSLNDILSPAEDDNKNGYVDSGDYLGGWLSILDRKLMTFPDVDKDHGIFLELFEVPKGEVKTEEELTGNNKYKYLAKQGGPYYSTSRLKLPFGGDQLDRAKFKYQGENFTWSKWNIGLFFWAIDPQTNFFGKRSISANIVLTDLKPDTKYYYRLVLHEDDQTVGIDENAITQMSEKSSFTTDSTKQDPSPAELQAENATSNGSSEDGNIVADVFGDSIECTLYPSTWFGCFAIGYYNTIYYITGWAVRGTAGLMDIFMAYSLGSFIYKNSFIDTGWTVVRDVCNIFFIFILLWTAFKMVINNNHFKAQEVIVNIIVIGLLINFSLFFSKVIIDMGNISARVFYNQIRITGTAQDDVVSKINTSGDVQPKAISEALANGLDLTAISNDGFKMLAKETGYLPLGTVWLLLFLGTIVNVAAAWIFIKISFAFLGRILSLWMAMIFSPFAFTSTIIGGGHGAGGGPLDMKRIGWTDWLRNILEASFYPALYLFFVFLIILLINDNFVISLVGNTDELAATPFLIVTLFKLAFILGLLKVSGDFAKKMAGSFGNELTAVAGKAAAFVGGAAIGLASGGAAFVGRNTIGRAAGMIGTEERIAGLQEKAAKGGAGGWVARQQLKTIQGAQKASFDVRQTGVANKISAATGMNMDALGRVPGLGFLSATGSAGGIEGVRERKIAKMQARAESLGENKKKKHEIEEEIEKRKKKVDETEELIEQARANRATIKAGGTVINPATGVNMTPQEAQTIVNNHEKTLRELKKGSQEKWTAADVGTAVKPNGKTVTAADVDQKKILGLEEMEKALKNNSKALAREYMSNQIRRTSPNAIGADKLDGFGNIKEFGHASVGVISRMDTLTRILRNMAADATRGGAVGALFTGFNPVGIGIGAAVGAMRSASDSIQYSAGLSGKLAEYAKRNTDEALHAADHATQPSDGKGGHAHGPTYKSTYKGPTMNIFSGLFSTGGGGGGHDDHGGGHGGGHDDHGHGGGGHH